MYNALKEKHSDEQPVSPKLYYSAKVVETLQPVLHEYGFINKQTTLNQFNFQLLDIDCEWCKSIGRYETTKEGHSAHIVIICELSPAPVYVFPVKWPGTKGEVVTLFFDGTQYVIWHDTIKSSTLEFSTQRWLKTLKAVIEKQNLGPKVEEVAHIAPQAVDPYAYAHDVAHLDFSGSDVIKLPVVSKAWYFRSSISIRPIRPDYVQVLLRANCNKDILLENPSISAWVAGPFCSTWTVTEDGFVCRAEHLHPNDVERFTEYQLGVLRNVIRRAINSTEVDPNPVEEEHSVSEWAEKLIAEEVDPVDELFAGIEHRLERYLINNLNEAPIAAKYRLFDLASSFFGVDLSNILSGGYCEMCYTQDVTRVQYRFNITLTDRSSNSELMKRIINALTSSAPIDVSTVNSTSTVLVCYSGVEDIVTCVEVVIGALIAMIQPTENTGEEI